MLGRKVPPGRLRRRLTLAFMLVAAVSATVLAVGSYLIVRNARLDDSLDRSLEQARATYVLASTILNGSSNPAATQQLLDALERRPGFEAVVIADGEPLRTSLSLGTAEIPADLQQLVQGGKLAYERTETAGKPYLIVGGKPFRSDVELYLFFSEEGLFRDLHQLAAILFGGIGLVVVLAGAVGALLARRTLRPVAEASDAARSLAEGLLETRLPVERHDEFGAWAASFNEMADALEQKIGALSEAQARERRFTADVAHELRTPLTALVNETALLSEHLDRMPPEAQRPAALLANDVARLRRLVEELLEISRLDAGREIVEPQPVDVRSLVDGLLRARGLADRVTVSGDGAIIETDPRRLERVLANLVENAVEHGSGDVSLELDRANGVLSIDVVDEGAGITAEHLPHVFDRFYKADPSRPGGTGLGLAIALENARLLGGDISAMSEPGRGARFSVRLPVAQPLHGGEPAVTPGSEDGRREPPKEQP
jgi:two-component system, OmpR family, sensor histidine kinase MtrB